MKRDHFLVITVITMEFFDVSVKISKISTLRPWTMDLFLQIPPSQPHDLQRGISGFSAFTPKLQVLPGLRWTPMDSGSSRGPRSSNESGDTGGIATEKMGLSRVYIVGFHVLMGCTRCQTWPVGRSPNYTWRCIAEKIHELNGPQSIAILNYQQVCDAWPSQTIDDGNGC